ncbi:lipopolysaccharide biosynthesis protein [Macrococcus sp. EM39E]|uniref:lipopolysaccharide biosynthesis protein n=1 Tax=Macrococcus animalis TaxID=3395467 RepID=UPI0039BE1962
MKYNEKKIFKGTVYIAISTVFNIFIKILTLVLLSRMLTPTEFGIVAAVQIIVNFSEIFWMMGVGPAIVQKRIIKEVDITTGFYINLIFGCVISLLIFLLNSQITMILNINDNKILYLVPIIFIIKSLSSVSESMLQREMFFGKISIANMVSTGLYFIVSLYLAHIDYAAYSLIIAIIIQAIINSLIMMYLYPISLHQKPSISSGIELLKYGVTFTISRIFNTAANDGDNFVIGKFLGSYHLGNYNRAYQLLMVPTLIIGTLIEKILFPLLSKNQDDYKKVGIIYTNVTNLVIIITFPVMFFIIPSSEKIIHIILGNQWGTIIIAFQILFTTLFFRVGYKICDTITYSLGKVKNRVYTQVFYATSVIIGAIFGSKYGINGVAISTSISIFLNYCIMNILVLNILKLKFNYFSKNIGLNILFNFTLCILLSFVISIINLSNDYFDLLIKVSVFITVYFIANYYFINKYFDTNFKIFIYSIFGNFNLLNKR